MMRYLLAVLPLCFLSSFYTPEKPGCTAAGLHKKSPFRIGCAINTDKLKFEPKYWEAALAEFNSFTPEKVMKPAFIHPKKDHFDFTETDHLVEFCAERNIRLHGHTLLWHKAEPAWLQKFEGGSAEWDSLLKRHIQTIVGHYKGRIKSWDVVNEAFNDDGSLRKTIWLQHLGPLYLSKAFKYAAEADPAALLFYNDYSLEHNSEKLDAVLKFMSGLRAGGVRVDGIGMQMHVSLHIPSIGQINGAAKRIAAAGYLVHYSELDVNLKDARLFAGREKIFALQETRYREIIAGYMQIEPSKRFGITLWGVSDNDSWLNEESVRARPLLFDRRYRAKPAYCGFVEGLGSAD